MTKTNDDALDAARWRFVRDHGLVWLEPPFDGCTEGRVGDDFATRYVDHRIAHEPAVQRPPLKKYIAYTSDMEPEPPGPYVGERQNAVEVYLAADVDAVNRTSTPQDR